MTKCGLAPSQSEVIGTELSNSGRSHDPGPQPITDTPYILFCVSLEKPKGLWREIKSYNVKYSTHGII